MKEIKAEIIAVGTELLLGQIANTNAKWLSEQLAYIGVNTYYHSVVGDNLNRLVNVFKTAKHRSNVIIVMGGLGPTSDDLTREGFQQISHLPIVEEKNAMAKILHFYETQNITMTENNRRQARIFQGAKVIENKLGMAPGMIVTFANKLWIFLPGVPREMKQMVNDSVVPYLQSVNGDETIIQSRILRLIGIGESALEAKLAHLIEKQTNPTIALLAQNDGNIIRLTAKAPTIDRANILLDEYEYLIEQKVGQYIFGSGQETIEEKIYYLLKNKNKYISAAESLTGGLFTERLINVPGASEVIPGSIVSYDARIKKDVLNVSEATIKRDGTVSEQCAYEMAKNVAEMFQTDYGISFTGVAGPDRTEGKPVGTVYIAIYHRSGKKVVEQVLLSGDRYSIRHRAVLKGYEMLLKILKF
ncbi:MAG TPA: competence/damage-inducible protein A [Bacillota bacterium]|nr:competence/damage-inducible protein A [Bacillota bacterium]